MEGTTPILRRGVIDYPASLVSMADWRDQARCRDLPADEAEQLFFPGVGKPTTAARVYCAECPVRRSCLELAMATPELRWYGIYGGLSPRERQRLWRDRKRAAGANVISPPWIVE